MIICRRHRHNYLLCVAWGVKLHSLTH